ncbi:MAG: DUF4136 domain-containing protein [Pyrinomonadaceae bacterium]
MIINRIASLMGLVLCMFVALGNAQSVQSDLDKSFDFSKLKTFEFSMQTRGSSDPLVHDQLNNGRIRNALESKLIAGGYRSDSSKPDFAVAYYVTTKNALSVQNYGYAAPRWFGGRDIRVDQYTEGTLTVDLIDLATNQLVWRGRASGAIELKNIDNKINKSVEKLVERFLKDVRKKTS